MDPWSVSLNNCNISNGLLELTVKNSEIISFTFDNKNTLNSFNFVICNAVVISTSFLINTKEGYLEQTNICNYNSNEAIIEFKNRIYLLQHLQQYAIQELSFKSDADIPYIEIVNIIKCKQSAYFSNNQKNVIKSVLFGKDNKCTFSSIFDDGNAKNMGINRTIDTLINKFGIANLTKDTVRKFSFFKMFNANNEILESVYKSSNHIEDHKKEWTQIWENTYINLIGDIEIAKHINYSLFRLLSTRMINKNDAFEMCVRLHMNPGLCVTYFNDFYKNLHYKKFDKSEIYKTAIVSIHTWNFFRLTYDRHWLKTIGFPILYYNASFLSKTFDTTIGVFGEVNDFFTNMVRRQAIRFAIEASYEINACVNEKWVETLNACVLNLIPLDKSSIYTNFPYFSDIPPHYSISNSHPIYESLLDPILSMKKYIENDNIDPVVLPFIIMQIIFKLNIFGGIAQTNYVYEFFKVENLNKNNNFGIVSINMKLNYKSYQI